MKGSAGINLLAFILFIFVIQIAGLQVMKTHFVNATSSSRTATLYKRCPWVRVQFYNMQSNQSLSFGRLQTASQVGLDGDKLIHAYLTKNTTQFNNTLGSSKGSWIVYFIFMAIGLVAMIIVGLILSYCCCKPKNCPPCDKFKQPLNVPYTNCQLKWPAVVIILLALITIGVMIAVLAINPTMQRAYNQTRCSVAILFDDLLNGNYTKDGTQYWTGLKPLATNLGVLSNSLQNVLSSPTVSDGSKILNAILQQISNLKHDVSNIPNGDGVGSKLDLNYNSPINSTPNSTNITIPSTFADILGDNSTTFSLVGQTYGGLVMAQHTLLSLSDLSSFVEQGLPKLTQISNTSLIKYAKLVNSVQQMDQDTDNKMTQIQDSYLTPALIIIYIIAALMILFSIVAIVATCLICFGNKFNYRKILYVSVITLTILGILCFILSLVFSASTVGVHYGCHYLQGGFSTQADFKYRFAPIINNTVLTQMMAQCATQQGKGNLLNSALGTDLSTLLSNTHQSMGNLSHLNANQLVDILSTSKANLTQTILSYYHAQAVDIDSIPDLEILDKLSNPKEYSCSSAGFQSDSWIPSTNQDSIYVTCKVNTTSKVTSQTCSTQIQFENKGLGCSGCIDTFDILKKFTKYSDVLSFLNKRYPTNDCSTFNTELANVWQNFYKKKQLILRQTSNRASQVQKSIEDLNQKIIANYDNIINKTINHLQSSLSTVTVPILEQTVTQVNCKVLGQDMVLGVNTFCTKVFNYSFILRVFMITGGFCMLGILIFGCCLGIRAYKTTQILSGMNNAPSKSFGGGDAFQNNDGESAGNKIYEV